MQINQKSFALVQLIDGIFSDLKVNVVTKLNNRKILSGIAEIIGQADKIIDITVAMDKLDKIGLENVNQELLLKDIERYLDNEKKIFLVGNKADLCLEKNNGQYILNDELDKYIKTIMQKFKIQEFIKISAKTGENIDKLLDMCVRNERENGSNVTGQFMMNARHKFVFEEVMNSLDLAIELTESREPIEMIAMDIRRAIDLLGEVLGVGIEEEILNRIFSNFCVGK